MELVRSRLSSLALLPLSAGAMAAIAAWTDSQELSTSSDLAFRVWNRN